MRDLKSLSGTVKKKLHLCLELQEATMSLNECHSQEECFFFTRGMGYLNLCDDDGDRIFHNFALTHDASYLLLIVAGYRGIIRLIKCLMAYKALCWPQKCYQ